MAHGAPGWVFRRIRCFERVSPVQDAKRDPSHHHDSLVLGLVFGLHMDRDDGA